MTKVKTAGENVHAQGKLADNTGQYVNTSEFLNFITNASLLFTKNTMVNMHHQYLYPNFKLLLCFLQVQQCFKLFIYVPHLLASAR